MSRRYNNIHQDWIRFFMDAHEENARKLNYLYTQQYSLQYQSQLLHQQEMYIQEQQVQLRQTLERFLPSSSPSASATTEESSSSSIPTYNFTIDLSTLFRGPGPGPEPLTDVELDTVTRTCLYSEIQDRFNTECPISQQPFRDSDRVTQIIGCRHLFTSRLLHQWFRGGNSLCPMCRFDIRQRQDQDDQDQDDQDQDQDQEW
jgi:hypothetical protein